MNILSALLFGISTSLDSLLLGITYGLQGIHIKFRQNMLISLITLAGTCLALLSGQLIMPFLPAFAADLIGSAVLVAFGAFSLGKVLGTGIADKQQTAHSAAASPTGRKLLLIGLALSANNTGIGFSASIAGLSMELTVVFTLLFSISFLAAGNRLGRSSLLQLTGRLAEPLAGILLILLGICELL